MDLFTNHAFVPSQHAPSVVYAYRFALDKLNNPTLTFLGKSCAAGALSKAVCFPFDAINLIKQDGKQLTVRSLGHCNGFRGAVSAQAAKNAVSMWVARALKDQFARQESPYLPNGVQNFCVGFTTGALDALLFTPFSIATQYTITGKDRSLFHAFRRMAKQGGIRQGIYQNSASLVLGRNSAYNAVFFSLLGALSSDNPVANGICAAACSAAATTVSYPLERMRFEKVQHLELKDKNAWQIAKAIFTQQGIRGFTRGLSIAMFRQACVGVCLSIGIKAALGNRS